MSGKFINTEYRDNLNTLVDGLKNIIKNPYYVNNDKSGTVVDYYNQNKEASTLDEASKLYYADIGHDSPIKYNIIKDMIIYGLEQIIISMENGEFGPEAGDISGEAVILPNTIIPYVGDYFSIKYTEEKILYRVIDVTPDTLENGANFYKIQYKMESSDTEDIIEENIEDKYHMMVNNIGTGFNAIIRDESYKLIKKIDQVLYNLRTYYKSVFYKNRVQTFVFMEYDKRFYDPFMIEFLRENKILDAKDEYIYLTQQMRTSVLFPINYNKTFFKCLESKDKDRIYSYRHRAVAEYISDPTSIFQTRLESYFEIKYDTPVVNYGIMPCFKDDFINAVKNNKLLEGDDAIYNIIIKYFNNEKITQEDIDVLECIDFCDNITIFYAIPCIIYCLEVFIKSLMKK